MPGIPKNVSYPQVKVVGSMLGYARHTQECVLPPGSGRLSPTRRRQLLQAPAMLHSYNYCAKSSSFKPDISTWSWIWTYMIYYHKTSLILFSAYYQKEHIIYVICKQLGYASSRQNYFLRQQYLIFLSEQLVRLVLFSGPLLHLLA